jgi:hypothetical protein
MATPRGRFSIFAALANYATAETLNYIEGRVPDLAGLRGPYNGLAVYLGPTPETIGHYSKVVEEFLEAFGTTIFLVTFLNRLLEISPRWLIQVKKKTTTASTESNLGATT